MDRYSHVSSYAFVDDYVLLPNVKWREPETLPLDGIIAFEKHPWPRAYRVVAASPWTVRITKEREFQQRLSQHPEAKRAWDKCLAAGECMTVEDLRIKSR